VPKHSNLAKKPAKIAPPITDQKHANIGVKTIKTQNRKTHTKSGKLNEDKIFIDLVPHLKQKNIHSMVCMITQIRIENYPKQPLQNQWLQRI
jgi:hypothetical protein